MTDAGQVLPPQVVRSQVTTMIERLLVGYLVLSMVPAVPPALAQLPHTRGWWLVLVLPLLALSVVLLVVAAVRRAPVRRWAALYALSTGLALVTAPAALPRQAGVPWLWWLTGTAVVCAGIWARLPGALGGGLVLGAAWGVLRALPEGGSASTLNAWSDALVILLQGTSVASVAVGMVAAAESADVLAAAVRRRRADAAVAAALAAERARLDSVVHDHVLTALSLAGRAEGAEAVRATARLAGDTIEALGRLRRDDDPVGSTVSAAAFEGLLRDAAGRVSPDVDVSADGPAPAAEVGSPLAQAVLAGAREALRNAVRHGHGQHVRLAIGHPDPSTATVEVRDDGPGFDPATVPASRLGVRLSMVEVPRGHGAAVDLDSRPGAGTRYLVRVPLSPAAGPRVTAASPAPADDGPVDALPASFPVRPLVVVVWAGVLAQLVFGVLSFERYAHVWPVLAAMALMCVAMGVALRAGSGLRLGGRQATVVTLLCVAVIALMLYALLHRTRPDPVWWHGYLLQLVLVVLVLRRRTGHALLLLAATLAGYTAYSLDGGGGWATAVSVGFGPLTFFLSALFVSRSLEATARRTRALRTRDLDTLRGSAARAAAVVQRRLWISDVEQQAGPTLEQVAAHPGALPGGLRAEALRVEATLRETLVARSLMSDELADAIAAARGRGVEVVLVDHVSHLEPALERALLAEVRAALARPSLRRLVVRVAPDGEAARASVLSDDERATSVVRIEPDGARSVQVLPAARRRDEDAAAPDPAGP